MIRICYFTQNKIPAGTRLVTGFLRFNKEGHPISLDKQKDIGVIQSSTPIDARYSRIEAHVREDVALNKIFPEGRLHALRQVQNE